ncbi:MAG: fused MFS/spermidine synthase [Bryobacteraceae bacterium]|nr:fused MFS/spermidine synthase [Bryobacteraceae bacterium]
MATYAGAIFLSAFLLFLVQPVVAKMIVPWFGGSAAVWTTCLLFFQLILLLGYGYAHWLVKHLDARRQSLVHLCLLGASLLWLPLGPALSLKPTGVEEPIGRILLVLGATVGLPYFLLSTTGPLLQAWSARSMAVPYRLYALSNLASLLALVAYPFAIEPAISLRAQCLVWTALYVVWAATAGWLAWQTRAAAAAPPSEELAPSWQDQVTWAALAFFPSALLLATSNHLSQNIAAIPFLWVLPLSIYLLSFVLTFDSSRFYHSQIFRWALAIVLAGAGYYMVHEDADHKLKVLLPAFLFGLWIACMYGHGELARRKPAPAYLTSFYLMLSLGGALGGLAISILAPMLLRGNYELPIVLSGFALLVALLTIYENWIIATAWGALAIYLAVAASVYIRDLESSSRVITRNFFGTMRVRESGKKEEGSLYRTLIHGTINHGEQFFGNSLETSPTTYYGLDSGVGLAITKSRMPVHPNLRIGVIGLGVGTLANYGQAGDTIRFYEINPRIVEIARSEFTYLRNCKANVEITMGDARLSMEREAPQNYDVLAVDAFSSDSIPVHLLTKEAVALMVRHLRPNGILAIHISNKHLNLDPIVHRIGQELQWTALTVENEEDQTLNVFSSDWVLLTRSATFLHDPNVVRAKVDKKRADVLWTDDYSNLLRILK